MEIKRMFVRPKAWGRGVGKRILEMLLAEVTTAGYTRYRLSTHHKLHTAQSLYRRTGYSEVPGSPGFPGIVVGVDICMEMRPVRTALKEKHLA
jgi:GNAT superfamily N-acetyltransferase